MQALVRLLPLLPPNSWSAAAFMPQVEGYRRVVPLLSPAGSLLLAFPVLLLLVFPIWSVAHLENAIVGLSCIAIATTLACFLVAGKLAERRLLFRRSLVALAVWTTATGLCCLLYATLISADHPVLTGLSSLSGAVLALLTACLLPFLLRYLLSWSVELQSSAVVLRGVETRFQAVTESSSDAFFVLEAVRVGDGLIEDFMFTFLNANAEKILDRPANEVLGALLTEVLPIDPQGRLLRQYRQVVLTGRPLIHEFPLDEDDPGGPWMRHHVARLGNGSFDDGDRGMSGQVGLAVTASDITVRKQAEVGGSERGGVEPVQHDRLTGLPNRRLLDDRMRQAFARADRYLNRVAVFVINMDDFGRINERYGRAVGDRALGAIAARIRGAIRASDSVIRLGGDEFVVLMPDMLLEIDVRRAASAFVAILRQPLDVLEAAVAVERGGDETRGTELLGDQIRGIEIRATASLGGAIYPDHGVTVDGLLRCADEAMDRAKAQGRNQYVLCTPPEDDWAGEDWAAMEPAQGNREEVDRYQAHSEAETQFAGADFGGGSQSGYSE